MALDWIPIFPDLLPRRRSRQGDLPVIYTAVVIPAVQAPGNLAFLARYPDQVPHQASRAARTEVSGPLIFPDAITPTGWLPGYPDLVPHRRLTVGSHPNYQSSTYGDLAITAQQLGWKASYPETVPHRRFLAGMGGGAVYAILPSVAAAVPGLCVALANDLLVSSTSVTETLRSATLVTESETSSTFLAEGIC